MLGQILHFFEYLKIWFNTNKSNGVNENTTSRDEEFQIAIKKSL